MKLIKFVLEHKSEQMEAATIDIAIFDANII